MPTTSGAGARLAHGQGADVFARDQLGQIAAFLRLRAVAPNLIDAQIRVRAVAETHGGGGTAHLLHGHAVFQVTHTGAAEFLLDGDAVQT